MINRILNHRNLLQDFSFMYLVVLLQRVLGIITTYFLVRVLTTGQLGEYTLIISYLSLFTAFSLPELGNAVMQSTARNSPGIYFKAQKLMFIGTVIGGLLLLSVAYFHDIRGNYSANLPIALACAAILFPFYRGITIWKNYRSGQKKFKELSLISSASHIISNIIIIIIIIFFDVINYLPLIIAYMLIPTLTNLIMSYVDCRTMYSQKSKEEYGMIEYGIKTSIYSAINTIALRLDYFIIFYLISPETLALFAIANKIPEIIRGITQTLGSVLAPRFAQHKFMTLYMRKAILFYALIFGISIIIVTFTVYPYFMNMLFGNMYDDAIFYSQVIMCSLIIGDIANLNFRYIRSQKDSKSYKKVTIIISIIRILSVILLVPLFGIWGAITSIFIYRISMLIIVQYIIKQKYSNPITT